MNWAAKGQKYYAAKEVFSRKDAKAQRRTFLLIALDLGVVGEVVVG